jgi:hypothetical protein
MHVEIVGDTCSNLFGSRKTARVISRYLWLAAGKIIPKILMHECIYAVRAGKTLYMYCQLPLRLIQECLVQSSFMIRTNSVTN